MALATKCPHCNTIFRVAADQLKLRGGIVRCGSCQEVFDGNAALVEPAPKPTTVIPDVPVAAAIAAAAVEPAVPAISSYVRGTAVDFELDFEEDAAPAASAAPAVWRSGGSAGTAHPTPEEQAEAAVARAFAAVTAPATATPPWEDAPTGDAGSPLPDAPLPVDAPDSPADEARQAAEDAALTAGDAPSPAGDAISADDNAPSPAIDAVQPADDATSPDDDAVPLANDAALPAVDVPLADAATLPAIGAALSADDAIPAAERVAAPADAAALPTDDASSPADTVDATSPDVDAALPADDAVPPAERVAAPADAAALPADDASSPADTVDATLPDVDAALPADDAAPAAERVASPADDAALPADDSDLPAVDAALPAADAASPANDVGLTADDAVLPADDAVQPGDDFVRSDEDTDLPTAEAPPQTEDFALAALEAPLAGEDANLPADASADDADESTLPAETPSDTYAAPDPDFVPAFLRARPADNPHPDGRIEPTLDTPQEHIVAAALDDSHHFEDLPPGEQPTAEPGSPAADEPWSLAEPMPEPEPAQADAQEEARDDTALHAVAAVNTDAPDDGASVPDDEPASESDDENTAGPDDRRERALERAQEREAADARMRALAGVDETPNEDLDHSDLSFVKRHDRSQKYGRAMKIIMAFGIPLLLGGLVLQAATTFRDTLAASYPQLKPALAALCQPLACQVGLPTQLDALSIEQGELASMATDTFSFSTVLRNQSKTVQAWPHIELTLNDNADKPVVRRVFAPREYLPTATEADKGFLPRSEQSIKLYFELKALKASGYHIAIFYP